MKVKKNNEVEIKKSSSWSDDAAKSISAVSSVSSPMGRKVKLRYHDKLKALHLLSIHLGLLDGKDGPEDDSKDRDAIAESVQDAMGKLKY